jgi:hypothetical protein
MFSHLEEIALYKLTANALIQTYSLTIVIYTKGFAYTSGGIKTVTCLDSVCSTLHDRRSQLFIYATIFATQR